MKLELKSIKVAMFASEETFCFEANLYLDGKKAAVIRNEGHGGDDSVSWLNADAEKKVTDYFNSLPPIKTEWGSELQPDLEIWCGDQLNRHNLEKEFNRLNKRYLLVVQEGKLYQYKRVADRTRTGEQMAVILKEHPDTKFLVEMPFDMAIDTFKRLTGNC